VVPPADVFEGVPAGLDAGHGGALEGGGDGGGVEKVFAYRGTALSRLGALEAVLPFDPDCALPLGNCPAEP
jgi:hypothetical protein